MHSSKENSVKKCEICLKFFMVKTLRKHMLVQKSLNADIAK